MNDNDVRDRLRNKAVELAVPYLNGVRRPAPSKTQTTTGLEMLWDEGYIPARQILIDEGIPVDLVDLQMSDAKLVLGVIETSDLIAFPDALHALIVADMVTEVAQEPVPTRLRLDERHVQSITDFRVEMWSNESQHAGRPHVKVHLKNGRAISVSLDKEPENLTPSGGLLGEASALKVVKKHRRALLKLWNKTRPDDQKITPHKKKNPDKKKGSKNNNK